jgi:nucleoside-diphosphate-sugar epimerase
MKLAIIAGGNGLIGRSLATQLLQKFIPVIILGSSTRLHKDLDKFNSKIISYVNVKNNPGYISKLESEIKTNINFSEDSVFFNLAWRGKKLIKDGDISDQLQNVRLSCDFVKLAKDLKARKYILAGSMEELIFERFVDSNLWRSDIEIYKPNWYALAKVACRNQCAFEAYVQKIDFCYATISAVVDKKLRTEKFIETSIKNILKGCKIPIVENKELHNICSTDEISRQLIAIAKNGVNKSNYVLGTGESWSLQEYFIKLEEIKKNNNNNFLISNNLNNIGILKKKDFEISNLTRDTGYKTSENINKLFNDIIQLL